MPIETLSSFFLASVVLCVVPGPTIILVVGQALRHGKKTVIPQVLGVLLGDVIAMSFSLLGLGVLLATSALLFSAMKWIGALYLVFLGAQSWLKKEVDNQNEATPQNAGKNVLKQAFFVTVLNPKGIIFFMAFLPQFINPIEPLGIQIAMLMVTFMTVSGLTVTCYALFAGNLKEKLQSGSNRTWLNRIGGSALIGAGALTATVQS